MYDVIAKKRDRAELSDAEIEFFVQGYVAGTVPDYQVAALLMAIYLNGMTPRETAVLTGCMARSGDVIDLSPIKGIKVDKHSTGGVGDKTTLVTAPLVAACGVKIAKMSGRGLGHTGGTVDKMEAIPGMRTTLNREEFIAQVNKIGIAVIGQSGNLAPADKLLYALRDVTATVGCIPLIASSIMSKKLAAGADAILLDVKTGSGAFMKTLDGSIELAKAMVDIGETNGRRTAALISTMDVPLGSAIGNSLEVIEAVDTLLGRGPEDLTEVCLQLAAGMLQLAGHGHHDACYGEARAALESKAGFGKLCEMVTSQGGDVGVIEDTDRFKRDTLVAQVPAPGDGYVAAMDTEKIGIASVLLGAGRLTKEDLIDYKAGLLLHAKTGDQVAAGSSLATLYAADEERLEKGRQQFLEALAFSPQPPPMPPLVYARVDKNGVYRTESLAE